MTDKKTIAQLIKAAGADLAVIGNVKGLKWHKDNPAFATTSAEYRAASESADARKAEVLKLLPDYQLQAIRVQDIVNAVKDAGGNVGANQVKQWLEGKKKAEPKPNGFVTALESKPEPETFTFSKAQKYLFEALMLMAKPSDIEEAKQQVQKRLIQEREEEIIKAAQADFDALGWPEALRSRESDDNAG